MKLSETLNKEVKEKMFERYKVLVEGLAKFTTLEDFEQLIDWNNNVGIALLQEIIE